MFGDAKLGEKQNQGCADLRLKMILCAETPRARRYVSQTLKYYICTFGLIQKYQKIKAVRL